MVTEVIKNMTAIGGTIVYAIKNIGRAKNINATAEMINNANGTIKTINKSMPTITTKNIRSSKTVNRTIKKNVPV